MVVMGIIGLVGLAAVPSYIERLPERRLNEAAWRVYINLQRAKALAVSENLPVLVTFNSQQGVFKVWADRDGDGAVDTGEEEEVDVGEIPSASFTAYPSTATFLPAGTMTTVHHYQYVRVSVPSGGSKYIYTFPNGQIDPYRLQTM